MAVSQTITVTGWRARAVAWRRGIGLLGPAFVASVAYVDPGNFATNFAGGQAYGYRLIWVIVVANAIGMLVQWLAAKLGLATGRSLPELCRDRFPRRVSVVLWVQAELVAMATDLAEVLGGALGLYLLFGTPLPVGAAVTIAATVAVMMVQTHSARRFELLVVALLAVVACAFVYTTAVVTPDPAGLVGGLVPGFVDSGAVLFSVGILGATVMPHAVYAHSALTCAGRYPDAGGPLADRPAHRRHLLRWLRRDIVIAMIAAGAVNVSMLAIGAAVFGGGPSGATGSLEGVHRGLAETVGRGAALAFAVALLASGLAASGVGTYAGQVIMGGFLRRRMPVALRRAVTAAPALAVIMCGVEPTAALVASQVVLSFGIPFALLPLILLTSSQRVMGPLVNTRATIVLASASALLVIALDGYLVTTVLG